MNILILGRGKGSWEMRGQQLGAALGARVSSAPTDAEIKVADVVVLVKRAAWEFADRVRRAGKPIVWDALDFWRQPLDHRRTETASLALLRSALDHIRPALTIGATEAMATAAKGVYLPHQGWQALRPTPPRDQVQIVAYDGDARYLAEWEPVIRQACTARGWRFVTQIPKLSDADLLVAFRGGMWDGWICREWKSGVKVVNAIRAGRPLITQPSAAVRELRPCGATVETPREFAEALDAWAPLEARQRVAEVAATRVGPFAVEAIAAEYRALLAGVEVACTR